MSHVKVAVSIDQSLLEQVEALMRQTNLPRSRLFAMALEEFVQRRRAERITAALDVAYAGGPTEDEEQALEAMWAYHRQHIQDES